MPLHRILYFFNIYKWPFIIGTIFVILANIASSYTNKLVEDLINDLVRKLGKSTTTLDLIQSDVILFLLYFLGLTLISALFTFLMRQTIIISSRKIEQHLKDDLYAHIQKIEIASFKKYNIGDFMSRMSEDVGKIRELFGPAVMYLINMITTLSVSIYFMQQISLKLTCYALIPLPFLSFFIYFFNQYSFRFNTKLQEELSSMTSLAQESYNGIRIIKSFTLENKVFTTFSQLSALYKTQALKLVKLDSFFMPIVSLLMGTSILIAIYVGGELVIRDEVKIGGLTSFIMFVNRLLWPVMSIGWVANLVQRGKASLVRYEEIMNLPIEEKGEKPLWRDLNGSIRVEHLNYTYPDTGILALDDISFEIKKGERWLIVGKTGSGKTTLAEILMKFYPYEKGDIFINDINLREISSDNVRSSISYIPQDVFLFSDTVQNNIAFGVENASEERVRAIATDAQIHNEILSFQHQYETMVGERGITLSGGQKQRISIARALMKDSPIFLFDDCLSAVDVETERRLIEAMNQTDGEKTMILITHRIFNQLHFDHIIVLHDGKIIEKGTHEVLMAQKGYYFDLYQKQELSEKMVK